MRGLVSSNFPIYLISSSSSFQEFTGRGEEDTVLQWIIDTTVESLLIQIVENYIHILSISALVESTISTTDRKSRFTPFKKTKITSHGGMPLGTS